MSIYIWPISTEHWAFLTVYIMKYIKTESEQINSRHESTILYNVNLSNYVSFYKVHIWGLFCKIKTTESHRTVELDLHIVGFGLFMEFVDNQKNIENYLHYPFTFILPKILRIWTDNDSFVSPCMSCPLCKSLLKSYSGWSSSITSHKLQWVKGYLKTVL